MTDAERRGMDGDFRDPSAEYRSLPFWAWNARLDNGEVAAQIRAMKAQGMGGFFMHARDGLETPYMGEAWVSAVRTAIDTARETGLKAWLYDEDRWPSGSSGGKVPALGDAFRAKALTLEILDGDYSPADGVIALFRARLRGIACLEADRLDPAKPFAAARDRSYLLFRIETAAPDEWFNGESPPDNLNPDTVDAFIDLNYRPYLEAAGPEFGDVVPGIFTDEPSVHDRHSRYTEGRGWIPWTYAFAAFFISRRGYDPTDAIPFVYFDGSGQERIRHDYWRTVTELFSESYTKRLGGWCGRNGLAFTGHFLWENQLGTATRTGGAIMPHYRFQHLPGIDLLCERNDEVITVKQCSSVANQYGRTRVISETYGCTGWEFTFEGQKWVGDWQFALGVNVRSQHLALYSLKGCRKRDYPPVFNYNTSWWERGKIVEDYFARLSATLVRGTPVRDILVLHPASTAWSRLGTNPRGFADRGRDRNIGEVNAFGDEFNRFLRALLGAHLDFDLGDETILGETGRAETAGEIDGAILAVNLARYRLVVIPPVDTMLRSTLDLFRAFLDAGGFLVAMTPAARMVEGVPSDGCAALYRHPNTVVADGVPAALAAIESRSARAVGLRNRHGAEDPDLLCMYRRGEGWTTLFAVNTDRDRGREILVEVAGMHAVEELDPLAGTITPIAAETVPSGADADMTAGRTRFMADFGPAGSRLYRFVAAGKTGPESVQADTRAPAGDSAQSCANALPAARAPSFSPPPNCLVNPPLLGAFGPTARFARTAPNALVLDRCRYELAGGPRSDEMEVWEAQRAIRAALGMRQIFGNGLEQRYLWTGVPHPKDGTSVRFSFSFEVKTVPETPVFLMLEDADLFNVGLNGKPVAARADGWFLDKSFGKIALPALRPGSNEIVLSCAYENRMEVEDCFLLGDFAVDACRAIDAEPSELRFGDWCLQGYPHYCGSMVYKFDYGHTPSRGSGTAASSPDRAILRLGEYSAVTVAVRVNGESAGDIPWRSANAVDLGPRLRDGQNRIEIEVVASPRNLLGPFHLARGKVPFNEWSAFRPEGRDRTAGYNLHPYGLFAPVTLAAE